MLLDFCIFCIVKSFCSLQQSSFESSIYLDTESALQIQYNIILSTPDIFHFEDVNVFFAHKVHKRDLVLSKLILPLQTAHLNPKVGV